MSRLLMVLTALGILLTATAVQAQFICTTQQITDAAEPPPEDSFRPSVNADGSRVVFQSQDNHTGDNADRNYEIFLWDNGVLTQITDTIGTASGNAQISNDGSRIVFSSTADLAGGGNADGSSEIFLYESGSFTQITDAPAGTSSDMATLSADGQRIAFHSHSDLTGGNPDNSLEVFLWDSGTLTQLSSGTIVQGSKNPAISDDGSHVAFISSADPLGQNPDNNDELMLWDGTLTQITQTVNELTAHVDINQDGSVLVLTTSADFAGMNANGGLEYFLYRNGTFEQVSDFAPPYPGLGRPRLSADGEFFVIHTSGDLIGQGPNDNQEVFIYRDGTFTQITDSSFPGGFSLPSISADGTTVAFSGDFNEGREIFLATCRPQIVDDIPTVHSVGLGILALILASASLVILRRRQRG